MKNPVKKHALKEKFNINDELYTPKKLVRPILDYVKDYEEKTRYSDINRAGPLIVWCPFDTEDSEFVIELKKLKNITVVFSHIVEGKDFFEYEPVNWDIAVSNPPFSLKKDIFERLFILNKPFAMCMNTMALNYQEIGELFIDKDIQLLIPDKKISFDGNTSSFNTCYVCRHLLPRDLIFCHIEDNNSGANYEPAKMYTIQGEKNK